MNKSSVIQEANSYLKAITKELYTDLGLKFEERKAIHFTCLVRKAQKQSIPPKSPKQPPTPKPTAETHTTITTTILLENYEEYNT